MHKVEDVMGRISNHDIEVDGVRTEIVKVCRVVLHQVVDKE